MGGSAELSSYCHKMCQLWCPSCCKAQHPLLLACLQGRCCRARVRCMGWGVTAWTSAPTCSWPPQAAQTSWSSCTRFWWGLQHHWNKLPGVAQPATACFWPLACRTCCSPLWCHHNLQRHVPPPAARFNRVVCAGLLLLGYSLSHCVLCCGGRRRLWTARALLATRTAWQP